MNSNWLLMILCFTAGCIYPSERFTERTVILSPNQQIRISELNLTLVNKGCGRKWLTGNGGERPYCDLELRVFDSVYYFGGFVEPFYVRNLEFRIDKMNPWNLTEDSVPPGGCRVTIKQLPDGSR